MKVVIDPGHGGKDPGAVWPRRTPNPQYREKDIALEAAKMLKSLLENRGAEVILTREKDEYLRLYDRAAVAVKEDADVFISLHLNSAGTRARGWEVWYHDYREEGFALAKKIAKALRRQSLIPEHGQNPRSDYQRYRRGFGVLRGLKGKVPGVLVELGFITNSEDRRILTNPTQLEAILRRIADAVMPTPIRAEALIPIVCEGRVVGRAKIADGRSYLVTPLRNLLEGLGMEVIWKGHEIEILKGGEKR